MADRGNWSDVERLLNARDAERTRRRRPHQLPAEWYRCEGQAYCLTLCARHHGKPFTDPSLASAIVEALRFRHESGQCAIFAYCLMPDHLHVILALPVNEHSASKTTPCIESPPDLMKLIADFKRYTATQIGWCHGLTGNLWQRDFYDHLSRNPTDFEEQCRYTLNNPVRAGLVADWSEYPSCGIMEEWRA
jgi:REP element-mobilizing transposase RayT